MSEAKSTYRIALFGAKEYYSNAFEEALTRKGLKGKYVFDYITPVLCPENVQNYATKGYDAVCVFVNSTLNSDVLESLKKGGVQFILFGCAGFDSIDLKSSEKLGFSVARVPAYSPYAVAEYAAGMLMTLNRKIHKAYTRVRDSNYSLDNLVGSDFHGKTVGIIGTGKIGRCFADIALGFGCNILAFDVFISEELKAMKNVKYVTLEEVFAGSDFISLHAPLLPSTKHTVNKKTLALMKPTALIVNTSRGGLVDTAALVEALESRKIKGAALDVYENEKEYFFNDCSEQVISDKVLRDLQNLPNVLLTSHMAFLTHEALGGIADTTLLNAEEYFAQGKRGKAMTNHVLEA